MGSFGSLDVVSRDWCTSLDTPAPTEEGKDQGKWVLRTYVILPTYHPCSRGAYVGIYNRTQVGRAERASQPKNCPTQIWPNRIASSRGGGLYCGNIAATVGEERTFPHPHGRAVISTKGKGRSEVARTKNKTPTGRPLGSSWDTLGSRHSCRPEL